MELGALERLNARHDLSLFDAGPTDVEAQSAWLRNRGLANDLRGFTRVFVTTYAGTSRVGGFFGLAPGSVEMGPLPRRLRSHGTPPIIPVILIARLAVDSTLQGRGVGRDLMLAALGRALQAHEHGGGALIAVDATGEKAERLYAHHGFVAIQDATEHRARMVLPMTSAAELLRPS